MGLLSEPPRSLLVAERFKGMMKLLTLMCCNLTFFMTSSWMKLINLRWWWVCCRIRRAACWWRRGWVEWWNCWLWFVVTSLFSWHPPWMKSGRSSLWRAHRVVLGGGVDPPLAGLTVSGHEGAAFKAVMAGRLDWLDCLSQPACMKMRLESGFRSEKNQKNKKRFQ